MSKLFSTRELFYRYPWLGRLRLAFFVWWCSNGIAWLDRSFRRVRVIAPAARPYVEELQKPAIFAMYHGRMVTLLGLQPRKRVTILISNSRDGEMIARALMSMGFSVARGSSGKGGVKGALEMLDAAQQGHSLAFMVDGPKGPSQTVKSGIIRVASMSGLPIVPMGHSTRGTYYMKSWDRFDLSHWSSPNVTVFGEPLYVPPGITDDECERMRADLESRMKDLHVSAEKLIALSKN